MEPTKVQEAFERLYQIIIKLRGPGGCPWDIEQTPLTLRETLIEECYETVEAITDGDTSHICEELGDVFLNVIMLSYIYEQQNDFTLETVLDKVSDKLIRRHPHVFGQTEGFAGPDSRDRTDTADKVISQWDHIKQKLEGRTGDSVLDGVSAGLPSLERAKKLQKKASKCGFDWDSADSVWPKLDEETAEFREAIAAGDADKMEDEFGDMLFVMVNIARHLNIDPGTALTRSNLKFTRRFKHVEKEMKAAGLPMNKETQEKMELFWQEAKAQEKR
ncbi:nucleoside triphosphate pyrophosphohydrolase [Brucepastera parasyntrophica]|uniref:nucleoside triphosphate pyrophosphohydrolase n=1 Tax=Brucepastera parasyntrophica TaxID=2880008 RepID=UPI00210A0D9A|nr:nucleoside triphosphate pyrophosphohydrolase [Brucepastera parasyntrophica]ULQ60967.1 nucleoside triphosphate pyrophosphohydrolase [Brucepastera parasyntrophica]